MREVYFYYKHGVSEDVLYLSAPELDRHGIGISPTFSPKHIEVSHNPFKLDQNEVIEILNEIFEAQKTK